MVSDGLLVSAVNLAITFEMKDKLYIVEKFLVWTSVFILTTSTVVVSWTESMSDEWMVLVKP
jgi:hypothetical protein